MIYLFILCLLQIAANVYLVLVLTGRAPMPRIAIKPKVKGMTKEEQQAEPISYKF